MIAQSQLADWRLMQGYRTYEIVFLGAMLVAIFATPIVARIARSMRILDQPGPRKVHAAAIPRVGGVAIVFASLLMILPVLALDNVVGEAFRQNRTPILAVLAGGLVMFAVGLIDDIRHLPARLKLLAQIGAALTVCLAGVRIESITLEGVVDLRFGWLSWPITILWIVGVTNALNLIDGLDGLAAGIATITCGVVAVFALYMDRPVMAVLMLALLGGLLGFLFLNFNPARIFMGDCGSMFLGFVISASSVYCAEKTATAVGLAIPLLAMGVPIFDTIFSITRRLLERRSIFSADRCHIHHRLLAKGLGQHQVAILVYVITLIAAGLGMFMMFLRGAGAVAIFCLVLVLLVVVFRAAGAVRLKDAISTFRRNRLIAAHARKEKEGFESAGLLFRDAKCVDEWWAGVCQAADRLDLLEVSLELANRDGSRRELRWRRPTAQPDGLRGMTLTIPVRQRRAGGDLTLDAQFMLNGSLESAGRRISLFCRLVDEHCIASLPAAPSAGAAGGDSHPERADGAANRPGGAADNTIAAES